MGLSFFVESNATSVNDTLYINRGSLLTVDSINSPYLSYNATPVFDKENTRIIININDTVNLVIINNDSLSHGFDIKRYNNIDTIIAPYDTANLSFSFQSEGGFIYYDHGGNNRYMGLGGMIVIKDPSKSSKDFYWNIKEHQVSFSNAIEQGNGVDWSTFYPDYFTINGNSNPYINLDTNARVKGNIGDTITIYMVNTGNSIHSIHFHGYHAEIKFSSKFPNHVERSKDTFPIYSMEVVVIELVPDKVGEYPVHDHNLVAVSGGKIYPNGMFVTLFID